MAMPSTEADATAASHTGAPPVRRYTVNDHQLIDRPGVIASAAARAERRRCRGVTTTGAPPAVPLGAVEAADDDAVIPASGKAGSVTCGTAGAAAACLDV